MVLRKQHPLVQATGRPDYSEIERLFGIAVERSAPGLDNFDDGYWDGVRQALGWVIGQYSDDPEKAED